MAVEDIFSKSGDHFMYTLNIHNIYIKKDRRHTTIYVSQSIWQQFLKFCRERGISASKLLECFMAAVVSGEQQFRAGSLIINANLNINVNVAKANANSTGVKDPVMRERAEALLELVEREYNRVRELLDRILAWKVLEKVIMLLRTYRRVLTNEEIEKLQKMRKELIEFLNPNAQVLKNARETDNHNDRGK